MNYKDLLAWQISIDLVEKAYKLIRKLPKEETYALADQMRRAAVSIPSNIAEGQSRSTLKEYLKFLSYAKGSRAELETQLILAVRLGYLTQEETEETFTLLNKSGQLINALIKSLR